MLLDLFNIKKWNRCLTKCILPPHVYSADFLNCKCHSWYVFFSQTNFFIVSINIYVIFSPLSMINFVRYFSNTLKHITLCNSFFFSKTSFLYKIKKTIYRGCINPRFVLNADYLILVCDRMKVKSPSWSFVSLISRSCFVWTLWCWVILLRYTLLWRTRSWPTFDPCVKWSVTRGYRVGLARVYPLLLFYYYNKFPLQYLKTNVLFFID